MELILEPRVGFLLATASGKLSFHEAVENCRNMCDFAAGLGVRKSSLIASLLKVTFPAKRDLNSVRLSWSTAEAD